MQLLPPKRKTCWPFQAHNRSVWITIFFGVDFFVLISCKHGPNHVNNSGFELLVATVVYFSLSVLTLSSVEFDISHFIFLFSDKTFKVEIDFLLHFRTCLGTYINIEISVMKNVQVMGHPQKRRNKSTVKLLEIVKSIVMAMITKMIYNFQLSKLWLQRTKMESRQQSLIPNLVGGGLSN